MLVKLPNAISGRCMQFFCSICMSLSTVVFGIFVSWSSQTLPKLMSEDTPLPSGPITEHEASIVSSLAFGGGMVGSLLSGLLSNRFGRKWPSIVAGVIMVISCVLITIAVNVNYLYASRLLCGISAGGCRVFIPAYICEISENQIRGTLGSISGISYSLGVVIGSIITGSMAFHTVPFVPLALLGVFFLSALFPDSPQCLLLQNRVTGAEESLKFFRRTTPAEQIKEEFEKMKLTRDASGQSLTLADFRSPGIIRAFILIAFIVSGCHMSGIQPLGTYSVIVLSQAGTSFDLGNVTLIFYLLQLITNIFIAYILDVFGRRVTMLLALAINMFSLIIFGIYYYILSTGTTIPVGYEWILIASFYGISASGILLINVPTIISIEITPAQLRTFMGSIFNSFQWLDAAVVVQLFFPAVKAFGMHNCVFAFAGWNIIQMIVTSLLMPETKGKSSEQIAIDLSKGNTFCCS